MFAENPMLRTKLLLSCALITALTIGRGAQAQLAITQAGPHLIVIKLVEIPGNRMPFAFEPASFTAQPGDTLEFVQFANTMHDVHFKTEPKGARLGSAAVSPYLVAKGQIYKIVVDSRFAVGTYELVCDPHEMLGMHGMLTVVAPSALAAAR
jgi:plastocyanin